MRLVWLHDGQATPKEAQRRMLNHAQRDNPVYSDAYLTEALEDLDALESPADVLIGPFSAFQSCTILDDHRQDETFSEMEIGLFQASPHTFPSYRGEIHAFEDEYSRSIRENAVTKEDLAHDLQAVVLPMLPHYLASASVTERKLLHYWVTCLSSLYLPISTADNPYRNIVIPLALKAMTSSSGPSGHAALLHAIYAVTASHWAQRDANQKELVSFAAHNYNSSLQLLRQSLGQRDNCQRNAILAAVILLSTMECFTGVPHGWRVHVKGGRQWLRQQENYWECDPEAFVLCQLFECIEVVGDTQIDTLSIPYCHEIMPCTIYDRRITQGPGYCLDKYLGLPKLVFDAICEINKSRSRSRVLDLEEITDLAALVLLTKPCSLQIDSTSTIAEKHTHHYSWAYHHACRVYFEREIRSTPSSSLQNQIKEGLSHFEEISALERTGDVCGLLWPVFVLACEAEQLDLRQRFTNILRQTEALGIANVQRAAKAIHQVWQQIDCGAIKATAHRSQMLHNLGFDLLLT